MARVRAFTRGRSRVRRDRIWQRANTAASPVVITTTQAVALSVTNPEPSSAALGSDGTVVRVRGNLIVSANPDAATDEGTVAMGLIVIPSRTAGAGGSALPSPVDDPSADWFWFHHTALINLAGATAPAGDSIQLNERIELDTKAMRKLPADSACALIVEAVDGATYASLELMGGMSVLIQH